jgi:predicted MFS family arabinose efflux permease
VSRGYRLVLANPGQRLIGAVLAVAILGSMAQTTYFSLWLAQALGADATGIALAFAVLGVAGAVMATLAGIISDWVKRRRAIIVGCLLLGGIAMLGLLTVHSFAAALVPIALTTASPAALGLTMALSADLGRAEALENTSDVALVVGTQRVSWQFGSILGPGLGALAVALLGRPADAILAGGLATLVAALLALRLPDLPRRARASVPSSNAAPTPLLPLILLMLAATLANAPVFSRIAYLSLYITGPLGLSPTLVSPAFALSSLIGFFTLSITGACVARWGALPVAIVVTLLAAVYGGVEGLAQSYWVVLAAQVVLGISYMNQPSLLIAAQEMAPSSNGLASGMQTASQALRSILGLLVLAPLVPLFGLGGTFLASGGLALVGIGLLIVVHRMTTRRPVRVAPPSTDPGPGSYRELS